MVSKILQASHLYYRFYWFLSLIHFRKPDELLRKYLSSKLGGNRELPMVSWKYCILPKEGGLGLMDIATQGKILAAKWFIRCLPSEAL